MAKFTKGTPKPPNSGRKKGSRNKATLKREAEIAESGLTPLEYFLKIVRSPRHPHSQRFAAAQAAAPYVHPKLVSTELVGPGGGPIKFTEELSDLEKARRIAHLLAQGVRAQALPAQQPALDTANREPDLQRPCESSANSKAYRELSDDPEEAP